VSAESRKAWKHNGCQQGRYFYFWCRSKGGATLPNEQQQLPKWMVALPILVLATYLAALLARFAHTGQIYLSFFVDDFYYYLVVGKNLAFHGASTFNGLQATNGYHPLWLLTIVLLYKIFGTNLPFFVAITVLIWLLVCGGYRALRKTQRFLEINGSAGLACALLSVTFMAVLSRTGMEVGLALFWLSLFWARLASRPLERQTAGQACLSGLLASALVLSRLDACLVVAAYTALTVIRPSGKRETALKRLVWFTVGLLPVFVYFVVNQVEFGTILPISGIAKNLKSTWLPSNSTVLILGLPRLVNILFTWPCLALCALFLVALISGSLNAGSSVQPDQRRVQLCVLLHPILFYGVLSFSSDWQMWWIWYLYPMVPIFALLAPPLIARWIPSSRSAMTCLAVAATCASLLIILNRTGTNAGSVFEYQRALGLQRFAASHPGRYAMGDDAAMASYLMPAPVLQLEGLVADKAFVDRIRRREPLVQALDELGVDYYITVRPRVIGKCYDVKEPEDAGSRSPAMQARLCVQPVADIRPPGDPHHALVFDVRQLRSQNVPSRANNTATVPNSQGTSDHTASASVSRQRRLPS
jgi:hypothetical protein